MKYPHNSKQLIMKRYFGSLVDNGRGRTPPNGALSRNVIMFSQVYNSPNEDSVTDIAAVMASRLLDSRALIFTNLMNGVPVWQVCRDFRKSEPDVMNVFRFVLRKIRSRRLERMEPPIIGNTIDEVRRQRIVCLTILPKLNLDRDPRYKDVLHEPVDLKNDGTVRNADFLQAMKPLPEDQRMPPGLK